MTSSSRNLNEQILEVSRLQESLGRCRELQRSELSASGDAAGFFARWLTFENTGCFRVSGCVAGMAPPAAAAKKAKAEADAAEAAFHLAAYLSGQVAVLDWTSLAALGQSKSPFVAGAAALPPSSLLMLENHSAVPPASDWNLAHHLLKPRTTI